MALKKRELCEKRRIKETLNADIATLQGKEPEESTSSAGSKSRKKRGRTEERPEVDIDQLADAESSKLLPEGLVKQEGDAIKVKCDDQGCDCEYISKPFHHFAVHGADRNCHMCSLYGKNATLSSLAEEYVKINKLMSKKKRK